MQFALYKGQDKLNSSSNKTNIKKKGVLCVLQQEDLFELVTAKITNIGTPPVGSLRSTIGSVRHFHGGTTLQQKGSLDFCMLAHKEEVVVMGRTQNNSVSGLFFFTKRLSLPSLFSSGGCIYRVLYYICQYVFKCKIFSCSYICYIP